VGDGRPGPVVLTRASASYALTGDRHPPVPATAVVDHC